MVSLVSHKTKEIRVKSIEVLSYFQVKEAKSIIKSNFSERSIEEQISFFKMLIDIADSDDEDFILDNTSTGAGRASTNIIDGALYFWEHFANATHNLAEYEGGYATRNLIDGVKAISNHILINASGVVGEKIPGRYIPVSQGFFVIADTGGSISFKNSQRIFHKEGDSTSVFMKTNNKRHNINTVVNINLPFIEVS